MLNKVNNQFMLLILNAKMAHFKDVNLGRMQRRQAWMSDE
jgi:hypothetical protein